MPIDDILVCEIVYSLKKFCIIKQYCLLNGQQENYFKKKPSNHGLSVSAAIPGSSLPSNNSKKAPPPVDINDTLYDSPIL